MLSSLSFYVISHSSSNDSKETPQALHSMMFHQVSHTLFRIKSSGEIAENYKLWREMKQSLYHFAIGEGKPWVSACNDEARKHGDAPTQKQFCYLLKPDTCFVCTVICWLMDARNLTTIIVCTLDFDQSFFEAKTRLC